MMCTGCLTMNETPKQTKASVILLVDDDPDFLEVSRHVLEGAGYQVLCAASQEDAMAKARGSRPDLVITDLMMSTLDSGFSLAQQMKQDPDFQGIPVIMTTGITGRMGLDFTPRTENDLEAMHVDAYFEKPVDPAVLLAKVGTLLSAPSEEDTE